MKKEQFAPIIIFAFNRLTSLKNTIASVLQNTESSESDLFVFVDGARKYKEGEIEQVKAVQEYVKSISGFKSLTYTFSENNKGLGSSIISGVTEVIKMYGRAIVLEDDLILSRNCLSYMNSGLELYEKNKDVFSICGYTNKIKVPKNYTYDSYFCVRSSSWGWATWLDRWESVDWELKDWKRYENMKIDFNKWGGSDCFDMLRGWKEGRNKSWAIRFCFAQFQQNKLTLFPIISKINNEGFDGNGTNCKKYSRFKFIFDETDIKDLRFPKSIKVEPMILKSSLSYHSIYKRIWSRIMYVLYR